MRSIRPLPAHRLTPEKLKQFRLIIELNQGEMSKALGYSENHYRQMELGDRRIPTELSISFKSKVIRYLDQQHKARMEKASMFAV